MTGKSSYKTRLSCLVRGLQEPLSIEDSPPPSAGSLVSRISEHCIANITSEIGPASAPSSGVFSTHHSVIPGGLRYSPSRCWRRKAI